jgi:serine/threonine protein kinase
MATETESWIGRLISGNRYRVKSKLGEGGMGLVYLARDRKLDTDVVIKVPRRMMLEDPEFVGRFKREIRSLVQLVHPHIVKVMDVGEQDGLPFAVMQFLSGGSLRDRQKPASGGRRACIPLEEIRPWLESIASALDFIHGKNYIHRDIKPDNILFDSGNNAYLSDFGVAKVLAEQGERKQKTVLTGAGMVLGTPQYMAPELIMGEVCDGRVDQYALAILVYELLTGACPFDNPNPTAIFVQHTTQAPPRLEEALPSIPKGVAAAVHKSLAKDAKDRFADCVSFARAVLLRANDPPMRGAPTPPATKGLRTGTAAWEQAPAPPVRTPKPVGRTLAKLAPESHAGQPHVRAGKKPGLLLASLAGLAAFAIVAVALFIGMRATRPPEPGPGDTVALSSETPSEPSRPDPVAPAPSVASALPPSPLNGEGKSSASPPPDNRSDVPRLNADIPKPPPRRVQRPPPERKPLDPGVIRERIARLPMLSDLYTGAKALEVPIPGGTLRLRIGAIKENPPVSLAGDRFVLVRVAALASSDAQFKPRQVFLAAADGAAIPPTVMLRGGQDLGFQGRPLATMPLPPPQPQAAGAEQRYDLIFRLPEDGVLQNYRMVYNPAAGLGDRVPDRPGTGHHRPAAPPLHPQTQLVSLTPGAPAAVAINGTILEAGPDSLKILDALHTEIVVSRANGTSTAVRHVTNRAFIRSGQFVEYRVPVEVKRVRRATQISATSKVSEITIHVNWRGLAPEVKTEPGGKYVDVRGHVRSFDPATGKLIVTTKKNASVGQLLDNDVVVTVRASDIRLASKGDQITVQGDVIMPQTVRASSLAIEKAVWQSPPPASKEMATKDAEEATTLLRQADKLAKELKELKLKDDPEWRKLRDVVIRAYERILEKYPESKAAQDAQERLDSLEK